MISLVIPPRPPPPTLRQVLTNVTVRTLMCGTRLYAFCYHDLTIRRPCRIARHGPGIIVCNHISGLDPLLLQAACPRLITWMMASEYYTRPLAWLFRLAGVIPVERSGRDFAATRAALRALREGKLLGVFPEGRISTTGELLPFQTGVAVMAARSGAPVYPAWIEGSQRGASMLEAHLEPQSSQLSFGQSLRFDTGDARPDALDEVIERIRRSVEMLAGNIAGGKREKLEMIGLAGRFHLQ